VLSPARRAGSSSRLGGEEGSDQALRPRLALRQALAGPQGRLERLDSAGDRGGST
jgi:hypothetical protein